MSAILRRLILFLMASAAATAAATVDGGGGGGTAAGCKMYQCTAMYIFLRQRLRECVFGAGIHVLGHRSRKIRFFWVVPKLSQLVFRYGRFGERALLGANSIDQYKFQFICQLRFQLSSVANTVGHPVVLAKKSIEISISQLN